MKICVDDYAYDYQSGTTLRTNLKNGYTLGARSVTNCKEYIYVLNNPRIKGADEFNAVAYTEILIFEWNGKSVGKHRVLCDLFFIQAFDGTRLYGITKDQEFVTLSFD